MIVLAKDAMKYRVCVTVDGMDVTMVATKADDVAGYVECRMWKGHPNPPGEGPEKLKGTVTLTGKVVISMAPHPTRKLSFA